MNINFEPHFRRYEAIVRKAENAFERIRLDYPQSVKCRIGCSDCCRALFDISLIEAIYINYHFKKTIKGSKRDELIEKANIADRRVYKIKRNAYRAASRGASEDDILSAIAQQRVRCPLLNDDEKCDLYEYRPITCRIYGVPTAIRGKGHTCGLSGFSAGEAYPTINMDILYHELYKLSLEMIKDIGSSHVKMADMLIPLSMALLTEYDQEYLGIARIKEDNR
ncbi:MAG: YkgJ family cysteine cluster protein [Deltaproteobacteria bacterium]|nr:YkgJ family cysteine cluster protein [Deltaproteobacteria bacterium]MBW2152041.1 YkgJ family cysteine cluster protein [Deltaproteobacteria bacterium]